MPLPAFMKLSPAPPCLSIPMTSARAVLKDSSVCSTQGCGSKPRRNPRTRLVGPKGVRSESIGPHGVDFLCAGMAPNILMLQAYGGFYD